VSARAARTFNRKTYSTFAERGLSYALMLTEQKIANSGNSETHSASSGPDPFVSVIMPVRNEAGFIERSVSSVLAQEYPHHRFEILIADGMSADGTRELFQL